MTRLKRRRSCMNWMVENCCRATPSGPHHARIAREHHPIDPTRWAFGEAALRDAEAALRILRMEPRISIVTIACRDLDRAVAFYEGMGLKRHPGITEGVAFFQMGGVILSLFPRASAEADSGVTFGEEPSAIYLAYNTRSE